MQFCTQIPVQYRLSAYELVKDVDIKDVAFVALNEFQKSFLWTGDKVLIKGLKNKGYKNVITTRELTRLKEFLSTRS